MGWVQVWRESILPTMCLVPGLQALGLSVLRALSASF